MPARRSVGSDDRGFSLLEVVVAMAIISIVMAASAVFLIGTTRSTHHNGDAQSGARVLADALDQVRALQGSAIVSGRTLSDSNNQWVAPAPGVLGNLTSTSPAYDPTAPAGATPVLPFAAQVTADNTAYTTHWYVEKCWQALAGGSCAGNQATGFVPFYRVVVAVTWSDVSCPNAVCSSVGVTLVDEASSDPVFTAGDVPLSPVLTGPGSQASDVGWPVSLRVAANGGGPPLTYTQTGLPPGLSLTAGDDTGVTISGTPTTAVSLAVVTLLATDGFGHTASALFNWAVNPAPVISPVADQTGTAGAVASLAFTVAGGSAPFSWTITGLPAGLSADPATGAVRGTPTTAGTTIVTAQVTDRAGAPATVTFRWTVNAALTAVGPGNQVSTVGRAVSLTLTANYGTPPYAWVVTGLPAGLAVNAGTGAITGTPITAGTSTVTATVTDSHGGTASTSFSWLVNPGLTLTPPGAQASTVGVPATLALSAAGGTAPLRWTITGLPAGLTYNTATGAISGTPTTTGSTTTAVTVTDAAGASAATSFAWLVNGPLVLNDPGSQASTVNRPATRSLTSTGGTAPTTWSATGLPPGLTLNPTSGLVSGTATATGTYSVTATVTDARGATANRTFTWTVNNPPVASNPGQQINTVGRYGWLYPYPSVTGGTAPYTWTITGQPAGWNINPSTGYTDGSATTAGSYPTTITVTDASGASSSVTFGWTVNAVNAVVNPGPQTSTVNRPDTLTLTSTGGTGPTTWAATGLPPGLVISSGGAISGTPTTVGSYTVTATVTDARGATGSATFSWTVNPTLAVNDPGTPSSTTGRATSLTFGVTGGTAPFTWAATGLPAGLSLATTTGVVSGTPTTPGTSSVTVTVTDSSGATASRTFAWIVNAALAVNNPGTPTSTVNRPVTPVTVTATGGTGALTWAATGLPPGLAISPGGVITGTPTVAGGYSVTVTVTDAVGATGTRTFTWQVNAAPVITDPGAQTSTVNRYDTYALGVSGGTGPYTWAATGLPAGLTVAAATGVISGTPTAVGTSSVTATVTDAFGAVDTQLFAWTVNTAPTVNDPGTQNSTTGTPVSVTLTSSGGTAPVTWAATNLPPGLTLNTTSGLISGNPTTTGSYSTVATVTDANGATASRTFIWNVTATPLVITGPSGPINAVLRAPISSVTATATGGSGAQTFSATGLPGGVTITSAGVISGTPTVAGTSTATITVTDSLGATASRAVTFRVLGITYPANGSTVTSSRYGSTSVTPVTAGNVGTLSYTYTTNYFPNFLGPNPSFNSSTGQITLSPAFLGTINSGSWAFTLTVRDAGTGLSYTTSFTWTIT